jgi:hypothetical protein
MSEEVEVMDKELPPPEIQNLIQHAMDQEYSKANDIFKDVMTIKLNDLLDQEQVRMADQIFNGVEDEDLEDDDEQLELDLEGESELESDEEDDEEDESEDESEDEEELEN